MSTVFIERDAYTVVVSQGGVEVTGGAPARLVDLTDVDGTGAGNGKAPVHDGASFTMQDVATQAEIDAHTSDPTAAHPASAISIADTALDFTADNVEDALAELQADAEADATALSDHIADGTAAHTASAIGNTPAGTIVATDVQSALNELDTEKAAAASAVMDNDAAGGVLSGTYPNPGFAVDMATQAELDAHVGAADPHTVYQKESEKGAANGYASLDASTLIPDAQIPSGIARDSEVTSAIATHEGAADPHTVYQLESQKGAANGYASLDGSTTVPDAQIPSGIARDSEVTAAIDAAIVPGDRWRLTPTSKAFADNPYSLLDTDDLLLVDCTNGAVTVNLPAASGRSGRVYWIKKTDSSVNAVTIDGNSSETVDGQATQSLGTQYECVCVVCDGSNWHVISWFAGAPL